MGSTTYFDLIPIKVIEDIFDWFSFSVVKNLTTMHTKKKL